jgi:hypothetical protein
MVPAWDGIASLGIKPEVAGTSVGNNSEVLGWGSNTDFSEVLGVHVILKREIFSEAVLFSEMLATVISSLLGKSSSGKGSLGEGNIGSHGDSSY